MLMAQYNKLTKYLDERNYFDDKELMALVDRLGGEAEETEDENNDLNERLQDMMSGKRRYYYGEDY